MASQHRAKNTATDEQVTSSLRVHLFNLPTGYKAISVDMLIEECTALFTALHKSLHPGATMNWRRPAGGGLELRMNWSNLSGAAKQKQSNLSE